MRPDEYGRRYWCVGVTADVAPDRRIFIYACEVCVLESGDLMLMGREKVDGEPYAGELRVIAAFAPGHWIYVYAASIWSGEPVAAGLWEAP